MQKQRQKAESRRQEALAEAKRLAVLLRDRFFYEALYMVGSALTGHFRLHSDLAPVIKDPRPKDFFRAHAFLLKQSDFEIDLKPFEELTGDFRDKVLAKGMKIG
jgi:hypothetical protein